MGRARLSVVMITKNEAALIADCLQSVSWADEIVVLDNMSDDQTREIATNLGASVYSHPQWEGFGPQRQRAQQYATGDYIFMIDADERMTSALRHAIEAVLHYPPTDIVYRCARRNLFLNRFMRHSGWYPDRVIRLYARERYCYSDEQVHESLDCQGAQVVSLEGELRHLTARDYFTFQRKQLAYAESWAKQHYKKGRRAGMWLAILHGGGAFIKTWLLRAGFLDGKAGLLLACVNAQYTFNKYAGLWALAQQEKGSTHDS